MIYSYNYQVYELAISSESPISKLNRSFYKISINPKNGDIYGTDPKDYKSNGWVYRYTSAYSVVDSFKVGIVPSEIVFN